MRIQSINVALPRTIEYEGQQVSTSIYKQPVTAPLMVRRLHIEGDGQADLALHGGIDKAVYAFPSEHYAHYQAELHHDAYEPGQFGENLTTVGLLETSVHIGDRYRVGDVLFEVSQPRSPCYKFAIKMDTADALTLCINSARTGFYLRVLEEGEIRSGDVIEVDYSATTALTVAEVHRLYYLDRENVDGLARAVACERLAGAFRDDFISRLDELRDR